ncbi:nuclear transport factor 2 family protein [Microbacterium sp. NPDC055910]|uniref:nuclear transport factor 2 family protein n=1 Tax=Microbacterium sp. NPDC055910 TaxID=3345659 RepID=UPI0035DF6C54
MSTQELVDAYFDAVNNHKWEELASLFHPDVTIQHGMSLTSVGREKAVKLLTAVVRQFAEHEDIPVRTLIDGTVAAIEIRFEGTLPNGTEVEFDAVDFIDTDGTHITKVASWYDTAVVVPLIKG